MNAAADPALPTGLAPAPPQPRLSLVPEGYAQKAMASLMQFHTELMDEKERRVALHRQLMEKEQALAELRMYVKLLEERVEERPPARPPARQPLRAVSSQPPPPQQVAQARAAPPPPAGPAGPPPPLDGWRSW